MRCQGGSNLTLIESPNRSNAISCRHRLKNTMLLYVLYHTYSTLQNKYIRIRSVITQDLTWGEGRYLPNVKARSACHVGTISNKILLQSHSFSSLASVLSRIDAFQATLIHLRYVPVGGAMVIKSPDAQIDRH
jgi:exosortase/archaeosortase